MKFAWFAIVITVLGSPLHCSTCSATISAAGDRPVLVHVVLDHRVVDRVTQLTEVEVSAVDNMPGAVEAVGLTFHGS